VKFIDPVHDSEILKVTVTRLGKFSLRGKVWESNQVKNSNFGRKISCSAGENVRAFLMNWACSDCHYIVIKSVLYHVKLGK